MSSPTGIRQMHTSSTQTLGTHYKLQQEGLARGGMTGKSKASELTYSHECRQKIPRVAPVTVAEIFTLEKVTHTS